MTSTAKMPLSDQQRQWYEAACSKLDPERLKNLLFNLTDIHSPTGATRDASAFMAEYISDMGMPAAYYPMNDISGNVLGQLRGSGGGATLLLYAPIDTHLEGDESDYPWAGPKQEID
ncbi:MAG: hypothetical protein ABJK20_16995, partial [Halieaceae bacterium]